MDLLIALVVGLIIAGLIYWAAHRIIAAFGFPPPVGVVVDVLIVVIIVLYLLRLFGVARLLP